MKYPLFEESRRCFKEITPFVEILGPRILLQIYPLFSEFMDERGVIFSLTLHPPGAVSDTVSDMINPVYHDKPLIFIGAIRLSLPRLFLTLYQT